MVTVGVPKETAAGERRVALVPETVRRLVGSGLVVRVQRGAGLEAGFSDEAYEASGAELVSDDAAIWGADVVLTVQRPPSTVLDKFREGVVLIGMLRPFGSQELVNELARRKVTSFALEALPRITRAQPMDALSSQSTVAGYKAVLLAAVALPKFFPMLVTAAGTLTPAKVLVLGAGVAGLQAIATARRLGAVVQAFDVRPAVKEQVESLGAQFLAVDMAGLEAEGAGGYARELSEEQHRRELELLAHHVPQVDVVICTALVQGRRAPTLVTEAMVASMKPGSVIVDIAAVAYNRRDGSEHENGFGHSGSGSGGGRELPVDPARFGSSGAWRANHRSGEPGFHDAVPRQSDVFPEHFYFSVAPAQGRAVASGL